MSDEQKESSAGNKKRIMVVDDSGIFLRTVKVMLESRYEVILVKSGEKAVSEAKVENPDLILLDYEMPGWDGVETLNRLRQNEKTARIPVIFLTGVNDRSHILNVLKLQPQGYVLKPVEEKDLLVKIRKVIG